MAQINVATETVRSSMETKDVRIAGTPPSVISEFRSGLRGKLQIHPFHACHRCRCSTTLGMKSFVIKEQKKRV